MYLLYATTSSYKSTKAQMYAVDVRVLHATNAPRVFKHQEPAGFCATCKSCVVFVPFDTKSSWIKKQQLKFELLNDTFSRTEGFGPKFFLWEMSRQTVITFFPDKSLFSYAHYIILRIFNTNTHVITIHAVEQHHQRNTFLRISYFLE